MRIISITRLSLLAMTALVFFSCDEKEEFITDQAKDYMLITPGKYITYRMDSMVFSNFGQTIETHRYQVKDQVDAIITDNLGRPGYRVFRSIRDSAGTQPWQPHSTYVVVPLADQIEVIDDNFRFIKLHMPVKNGFSWRGNKYLPDQAYHPKYTFSNDIGIQDWDFFYDGDPSSFSYRGYNYSNVLTVEQIDDVFNIPVTVPQAYGSYSKGIEKYSKGIGLVYKQYTLYEYQPNAGPNWAYIGFGITLWMIDHN